MIFMSLLIGKEVFIFDRSDEHTWNELALISNEFAILSEEAKDARNAV